jgi:hypothetical protein
VPVERPEVLLFEVEAFTGVLVNDLAVWVQDPNGIGASVHASSNGGREPKG